MNNIIGKELINGVSKWTTCEHCSNSLLVVVNRDDSFPFHRDSNGKFHDHVEDLSFILEVCENTQVNCEALKEKYPFDDGFYIHAACVCGDELMFYMS